jgi:dTDP-4-dehydrorhamnose reductase
MKILITGAAGQVGSALVNQFNKLNDSEVLAVARNDLNITNRDAVYKLVNQFKPDIIINTAAYTAVDKAEKEANLCFATNRDGPRFLAESANSINAIIIHISTDYVFSGDKNSSYSETDITSPQSIYGESKLAGELAVIKACTRHIILRTAWIFGDQGSNFVSTMLQLAKTNDQLSVVCDQFGGPTYAGDIASALVAICQSIYGDEEADKFGIYHFSGLPHVNWFQFAQLIFEIANNKGVLNKYPIIKSITTENYPTAAKRPLNSRLNTLKITNVFGINASDWIRGLEVYIKKN